ncbi:MAG: hypothetical protein GY771_07015 [bacterium]|nr:hypothetical protein [bacterium]
MYKTLYEAAGGIVFSNGVEVTFRKPNRVEEEILEAYWSSVGVQGFLGDNDLYISANEQDLGNMILKYPQEPMTKYLLLALARPRIFNSGRWGSDGAEEGSEYLKRILESYPDFRVAEVAQYLGTAYHYMGESHLAKVQFQKAMSADPNVQNDFEFMCHKIRADGGGYRDVVEWRRDRHFRMKQE